MKNLNILFTILIIFILSISSSFSMNPNIHTSGFLENAGQFDISGLPDPEYVAVCKRYFLLVYPDRLSFVLKVSENNDIETEKLNIINLMFEDHSGISKITPKTESKTKYNFLMGRGSRYQNIKSYEQLEVESIYPGINLILYINNKGEYQYDFELQSGADVRNIKINIEGAISSEIDNLGELKIRNHLGEIINSCPVSYQVIGQEKVPVRSAFVQLSEFQYAFDVNYDNSNKLIIDPVIKFWSSYYGGNSDDAITGTDSDFMGNIAYSGYTSSTNLDVNIYQQTNRGLYDAFVVVTDTAGNMKWATYYGGSESDYGTDVAFGVDGTVHLTGYTQSLNLDVNVNQMQLNNLTDAFLLKLTQTGGFIWATYWGGSGIDEAHGVEVDTDGNPVIVGNTSSQDFYAIINQVQNAGLVDAFYTKFSPMGNTYFSAYYGGIMDDYATDVSISTDGTFYLTGYTESSDLFVNTYQTQKKAGEDAFLAKIKNDGEFLWSTFYGGNAEDRSFSVHADSLLDVFITGKTLSTDLDVNTGQMAKSVGFDAFILKMNADGSRNWSSYYGGNNNDQGTGIITSPLKQVYICGTTESTNLSLNYYQTSNGGGKDAFIVRFLPDGLLEWGTYYGKASDESASDITLDKRAITYTVGKSSSTNLDVDKYQTTYGGGIFDGFILKFGEVPEHRIYTGSVPTEICSGEDLEIPFTAWPEYNQGNTFYAQLSDRYGDFTNPLIIGSYISTVGGTIDALLPKELEESSLYRIRVISSDPEKTGTDNNYDITIHSSPIARILNGHDSVCLNSIVEYMADSCASFIESEWKVEGGIIVDSSCSSISIHWNKGELGRVWLRKTNIETDCRDTTDLNVVINPIPENLIEGPDIVCKEDIVSFKASTLKSGIINEWLVSDGTILGVNDKDSVIVSWLSGSTSTITLIQSIATTGCSNTFTKEVYLKDKPIAEILSGDFTVCIDDIKSYTSDDDFEASYIWEVENGEIVGDGNKNEVDISWNIAGVGKLALIKKIVLSGCSDTLIKDIDISPKPEFSIQGKDQSCYYCTEGYSAPALKDYAYNWSVKNGKIVGTSVAPDIKVNWGKYETGEIILKILNTRTECIGYDTLIVSLAESNEDGITGSQIVCSKDTTLYSTKDSAIYSYQWIVQSGIIIDGITENEISIFWANPGIGKVKLIRENKPANEKDTFEINVDINPSPEKPVIQYVDGKLTTISADNYKWFFNLNIIDGINSQEMTPIQVGNYYVIIENEFGCASELSEPYYYQTDQVLDFGSGQIIVYPNPAQESLNISINDKESGNIQCGIEIIDMIGNIIYKRYIKDYSGSNLIRIDLKNFSTGNYLLRFTKGGKQKLIIVNIIK